MYYVYKATYGEYVYYGLTTSVKHRRLDHIRVYSTNTIRSKTNHSNDMLSATAKRIGVSPSQWNFDVVYTTDTKAKALDVKAKLIRENPKSINYVYKYTKTRCEK